MASHSKSELRSAARTIAGVVRPLMQHAPPLETFSLGEARSRDRRYAQAA